MVGQSVVKGTEAGDTLLSVIVAVALIGLAGAGLMRIAANATSVQAAVRLAGQKEDVRNVFRNSLVCQVNCEDLLDSIPPVVGAWTIQPSCQAGLPLTIMVRNAQYQQNEWSPLFPKGQESAICKQNVVLLPGAKSDGTSTGRMQQCPYGQVVESINFAEQTVTCRYLARKN